MDTGKITASTAKRLIPVLDVGNTEHWLGLAETIPQKELESEVAKANPKASIRERIKPLSETLLEFKSGIDPETERLLLQCKELHAQKSKSNGAWNDVLKALAVQYLKTNDPVEKAKRHEARMLKPVKFPARENPKPSTNPRYIPAPLKHQVALRDRGECQARLPNGMLCRQKRWKEIHHRVPLSHGGLHVLGNLITLCAVHHDSQHGFSRRQWKSVSHRSHGQ